MAQVITCPCGKVFLDDYKAHTVDNVVVCSLACAAMLKSVNDAFPSVYKGEDKEPMPEQMKTRVQ